MAAQLFCAVRKFLCSIPKLQCPVQISQEACIQSGDSFLCRVCAVGKDVGAFRQLVGSTLECVGILVQCRCARSQGGSSIIYLLCSLQIIIYTRGDRLCALLSLRRSGSQAIRSRADREGSVRILFDAALQLDRACIGRLDSLRDLIGAALQLRKAAGQ